MLEAEAAPMETGADSGLTPRRGLGTVLLSERERPLLLAHDATRQAHTLWAVRGEAEWEASACWEQEGGSGGAAASSFVFLCEDQGEAEGLLLFLLHPEHQTLFVHHLAPPRTGRTREGSLGPVAPTLKLPALAAQPIAATMPHHAHAYAAAELGGLATSRQGLLGRCRVCLWACMGGVAHDHDRCP